MVWLVMGRVRLRSPVVYVAEEPFHTELMALAREYAQPRALAHHYVNMAKVIPLLAWSVRFELKLPLPTHPCRSTTDSTLKRRARTTLSLSRNTSTSSDR